MSLPILERRDRGAIAWHTDRELLERHGVLVAFTERTGGVSGPPFASLNLAGHAGDDPEAVLTNRALLLDALSLGGWAGRLTCAEQVHGDRIARVGATEAGAGALPGCGRPPVAGTDALLTSLPDTPLLLCYADCVPVVLVALEPIRAVAVVHAGWRGALAGLPGAAARALALEASCEPSSLLAYVGPHVCAHCYEVGEDRVSQFARTFGTIGVAQGRLDLGAVVSESLRRAGVPEGRQARLEMCTAEMTTRFFSYRAEGVTGRHGAIAVLLQGRG